MATFEKNEERKCKHSSDFLSSQFPQPERENKLLIEGDVDNRTCARAPAEARASTTSERAASNEEELHRREEQRRAIENSCSFRAFLLSDRVFFSLNQARRALGQHVSDPLSKRKGFGPHVLELRRRVEKQQRERNGGEKRFFFLRRGGQEE